MAIDRLLFSPEQVLLIEALRQAAELSEDAARQRLIDGGLEALRLAAAERLYTTQPLTISEVTARVGLDRGVLIEWVHTHHLAPWMSPEDAAAAADAFAAWEQSLDTPAHEC